MNMASSLREFSVESSTVLPTGEEEGGQKGSQICEEAPRTFTPSWNRRTKEMHEET